MEDAQTILVIINSVVLTVFLILGIVTMVLAIRVFASLKRVAQKAESVVDSAEAATEAFKNASGSLAFMKIIKNLVELVQRKK